jgi:hypothetical protein
MSLTPAQAQELDRLACRALDNLRDLDRAAVTLATEPDAELLPRLRDLHTVARERAARAESELFDAIHALVSPPTRA